MERPEVEVAVTVRERGHVEPPLAPAAPPASRRTAGSSCLDAAQIQPARRKPTKSTLQTTAITASTAP